MEHCQVHRDGFWPETFYPFVNLEFNDLRWEHRLPNNGHSLGDKQRLHSHDKGHNTDALRFAARWPAAQGRIFSLGLPSTYPFSAQARLGPHWTNLWSRLTALDLS